MKYTFCICMLLLSTCVLAQDAWQPLNQEAKRHLINLININTSAPEPDELTAARYIYKELNKHGIDWDIFIPAPNRANLVARIKGTDATQKPLLLLSHLDTAPAGEGWTFPPLKATQHAGRIYGLGATDDKNYTAAYLALLTWLKDSGKQPVRDIIFLATSGEETGSRTGLLWLSGDKWERINPGYALNEGGGVIRAVGGADIIFAEAATKMYMDIKVTAHGNGGHTSIPTEENAVYKLSEALAKISAYNPPARLNETTRQFFKTIEPWQDDDGKTTINLLLNGEPQQQQAAAEVIAQDPFFRSQLKDTWTPTVLSASNDTSAASGEASALLNVRLLPDSDPEQFLAALQNLFTPQDNITLEIVERPQLPFPPPMNGTDPLFTSIRRTTEKLFPNAITVPGLSPASSDSEFLRKRGVITYGLGPEMDPQQTNSAHSADEFISEADFFRQLQFVAGVIFDFAYGQDLLPLHAEKPTSQTEDSL